jgi:uncharacterized protein (TIGR02145 family)
MGILRTGYYKITGVWNFFPAAFGVILMLTISCSKENDPDKIKDIDGNVYPTVTIGSHVWMAKNLEVTRYRNGDSITFVTDSAGWLNPGTGLCCEFENDPGNGSIYGKLYNWYAIQDSRNIAPEGWHMPSDAEWAELASNLGGADIAGSCLKETGTTHWNDPNADATNSSGFTALPGGLRTPGGDFANFWGSSGYWWSKTEVDSDLAYYFYLNCNDPEANSGEYIYKNYGLSVRCVKDHIY